MSRAGWGGTATSVQCNGPHAEKNDLDIYYGKGMLPSKLYAKIQASCDWDKIAASGDEDNDSLPLPLASPACNALLEQAEDAVGLLRRQETRRVLVVAFEGVELRLWLQRGQDVA